MCLEAIIIINEKFTVCKYVFKSNNSLLQIY